MSNSLHYFLSSAEGEEPSHYFGSFKVVLTNIYYHYIKSYANYMIRGIHGMMTYKESSIYQAALTQNEEALILMRHGN